MSFKPLAAVLVALVVTGCGLGGRPSISGGRVEVVAAENFWGSIAAQLGGDRVHVTSLITNPATDPHAYEATPGDARTIARAGFVIENGAGYDPWVPKLLAANPVPGRLTLDVGDLVGVREGGNPHLWYAPDYVNQAIDRITRDLQKLDSGDAGYFAILGAQYRGAALKSYDGALATIRERYSGTPVGATESIFVYLAQATGLDLVTPPGYLKATSEGIDPPAADKAAVEQQIATRRLRVFVFNSQNSTPEILGLVAQARAAGIPVVAITETLAPADLSFQDWQTNQLRSLLAALGG